MVGNEVFRFFLVENEFKVGRSVDTDMRIADISVS